MLSSFLILLWLVLKNYLSFRMTICTLLIIGLYILLKYVYRACKSIHNEYMINRKKKQMYGAKFQDQHYERLLQTPFASGVQEESNSMANLHEMPIAQ